MKIRIPGPENFDKDGWIPVVVVEVRSGDKVIQNGHIHKDALLHSIREAVVKNILCDGYSETHFGVGIFGSHRLRKIFYNEEGTKVLFVIQSRESSLPIPKEIDPVSQEYCHSFLVGEPPLHEHSPPRESEGSPFVIEEADVHPAFLTVLETNSRKSQTGRIILSPAV